MPIIIDLSVVDKSAAKKVEDVAKSLEKLGGSLGGAADQMERLNKAGEKAGPTMRRAARAPGAPPRIRFTKGPAQRLIDLKQQELLLGQVTDPTQRSAISQDIKRSRFLAQRSIELQKRRDADPTALKRPGLLELFGTLNQRLGRLGGKPGRAISQVLNMITGGTDVSVGAGGGGAAAGVAGGAAATVAGTAAVRKIVGGKPSIVPPPVIGGAAAGAAAGAAGGGGRLSSVMARISGIFAVLPPSIKILAIAIVALTAKIVILSAVMVSVFKAVATQGKIFGRGLAATGGDLGAFSSLVGVAKFLGTDPTTLANTIGGGGGGLKGAAIQGLGGSALPNFARPGLSNAENTRRIIDSITDPTRSNASIRRLTQMGGPEFERLQELRNLTPGQARRLQASAAGTVTPEQIKATAEFRAELVILGNAFEKLKTSVAVVTAIKFVTFHLELLARVLEFIGRVIRNIVNSIPGFNIGGGKSISEMAEDRMRENTKALRENSQRLSQNTETLGGGRRAQRALPPGAINDIIFNNGAPGAVGLGLL